ncbi:MAG: protein kinase, partial [Anaerolineae bacterium]|nr:protein kinase [Anaerolineae bacterium]
MADLIGQNIGQYRILEQIGKGGMATVYKAYQPSLDRYVAIKVLPPYFAHEEGFAERFIREARAIAKLTHPHILPIHDFGQEGDLSYIVTQYVEAGTLKDMLGQPMDPRRASEIISQIAEALDYAHAQGVIHRDVKPSNVLMDRGTWVFLTDFGLAKMVEASQALTASGVGVGTPAYMSPEQGQGLKVDARSDVYSLGIVLYEMLTGRVPFEAETPMAVVIKHITHPLPLPRQINPDIPESVERVILKALAKKPEDRFASTGEMAAALREAVSQIPTVPAVEVPPTAPVVEKVSVAPPPPPPPAAPPTERVEVEKVSAPRRKVPWVWVGAAAVAVVVLIGAALLAVNRPWEQETSLPTETPGVVAEERPTSTPLPPTSTPRPRPVRLPIPPDFTEVLMKPNYDAMEKVPYGEGWDIVEEDGNRVLRVQGIREGGVSASYPEGYEWTDYALTLKVKLVEGEETYIYFRRTPEQEGPVIVCKADGWELIEDPGWRVVNFVPMDNIGQWRQIGVIAQGEQYEFFVDGESLFTHPGIPPQGTIGLGVHEGAVALFDDLRVIGRPPEPRIEMVRVATTTDFPPFASVEQGKLTGFDIELMLALGEMAGFKVEFVRVPREGILEGLDREEYDAVIAALTITPERKERWGFSEPYVQPRELVPDANPDEVYGIAVRKGDQRLLDMINEGLRAVRERGILEELIVKWRQERPEPEPLVRPTPIAPIPDISDLAHGIPWIPEYDPAQASGVYYLGFNVTKPPFDDARVRRAFAHAVDRVKIAQIGREMYGKPASPATTFTPPWIIAVDLYGEVGCPYRPDLARELLAQAGHPNGEGLPPITYVYNQTEIHAAIAEAVAQMWRDELGVEVHLEAVVDWDAYSERLRSDAPPIFRMGWVADYNDPDNFLKVLHSGGESNYGHFANADFDRLVTQAAEETDPKIRQELYIEAEHILCQDEAALIPLLHT